MHFSVPGKVKKLGVTFGKLRGPSFDNRRGILQPNGDQYRQCYLLVTGSIVLRDGGGRPVKTLTLGTAGLYVVPGGAAVLTAAWTSTPLIGRTQAQAVIKITVNDKVLRTYTSRDRFESLFPVETNNRGARRPSRRYLPGAGRGRHWVARRFSDWREDRRELAKIRARRRAAR